MYNSRDWSSDVCSSDLAIVTGVATPAASACSSEPNSLRGEAIAVCYFTRFQQRGTPSILVRRAGQTRGVTYQASGLGPGSGQCSWILTARLSGGDVGGSDRLRLVGYATPGAVGLESGFGCNLNQATTLSQSTKTRSCGTVKKTKFIASRMPKWKTATNGRSTLRGHFQKRSVITSSSNKSVSISTAQ